MGFKLIILLFKQKNFDMDEKKICNMLKVIGNPIRCKILVSLLDGEKSVSELCKNTKYGQGTISHSLIILKTCGLVVGKKKGRYIFYSTNRPFVKKFISLIMGFYTKSNQNK